MATHIYTHALDETGVNPENATPWETITLVNRDVRVCFPKFGAFFTESLQVRETSTGRLLSPVTDYYPGILYEIPTEKCGKEICAAIVITNKAISGKIDVKMQVLGGPWGYSNEAILQMFNQLQNDGRPVGWANIIDKPTEFNPAHHMQDIGDLFGAEYIVAALERVAQAILLGDTASHDEIYRYIDALRDKVAADIQSLLDMFNAHIRDFNNPHRTTAHQVGTLTEAEILDLISKIPKTRVIQDPWFSGSDTLVIGFKQNIPIYSMAFIGGERVNGSFDGAQIKEFEVEFANGTKSILGCRPSIGTEVPGTSTTFYPIVPGDPASPKLESRYFDLAYLEVTATGNVGDEFTIKVTARDWYGNESRQVTKTFTLISTIPLNMANFTHTIPELMEHNKSFQVKFSGARTAQGGAVKYNITAVVPGVLAFNKTTDILENEVITLSTSTLTTDAEDVKIDLFITDGLANGSAATIATIVYKQLGGVWIGKQIAAYTAPVAGRYRVTALGGGGNGSTNIGSGAAGGGGGATNTGVITLTKGQVVNISAGGRAEASSAGGVSANGGTNAVGLTPGVSGGAGGSNGAAGFNTSESYVTGSYVAYDINNPALYKDWKTEYGSNVDGYFGMRGTKGSYTADELRSIINSGAAEWSGTANGGFWSGSRDAQGFVVPTRIISTDTLGGGTSRSGIASRHHALYAQRVAGIQAMVANSGQRFQRFDLIITPYRFLVYSDASVAYEYGSAPSSLVYSGAMANEIVFSLKEYRAREYTAYTYGQRPVYRPGVGGLPNGGGENALGQVGSVKIDFVSRV